MKIAVISIDPGKDGAIVVVGPGEVPLWHHRTSKLLVGKRQYSIEDMDSAIADARLVAREQGHVKAVIERVIPFGGLGAVSVHSMGFGKGIWRSILTLRKIPFEIVTPQAWQKGISGRKGLKGKVLKDHLVAEARRRCPDLPKHSGVCDAYLQGVFYMRQLVGGDQ